MQRKKKSGRRSPETKIPEYLKRYSPAQLKIILDEHPVKQVIAAAGSGKTRTVIGLVEHRLRAGLERPGRILLLSFSRKAAGEIRERLPAQCRGGVEVRTFHSFCYHRLRELHPRFQNEAPRILSEKERNDFFYKRLRENATVIGGVPYDLLVNNPPLFRRKFPELCMEVFRAFYAFKRAANLLEYEDLIALLLRELKTNSPCMAEMRKRYGLIIVDEFQDTDPRQLEFLRLMDAPRLLAVGDDWQAIYAFRGATPAPFLNFPRYFPGAKRYYLAWNYRSTRAITRLGNQIIRGSKKRIRKRVLSVRGRGPGLPVGAFVPGPGQEASLLALLPSNCDYMILCRSNFRIRVFEKAGFPPERLMTIHKAKGLEFPVVFLDLVGGWSGRGRGGGENEQAERERLDEEARIAYVGASRAMNFLVVLFRNEYRERDGEGRLWRELFQGRVRELAPAKLRAALEKETRYRQSESRREVDVVKKQAS